MAQITNGVRSILSHPHVYSLFQNLMGAQTGWRNFVRDYVRPFPGMKILDIGCGPCDILEFIEDVEYWGFDISKQYIEMARRRFGDRGEFFATLLTEDRLRTLPNFDVVIGSGLLHHLADQEAEEVMKLAYRALSPGGRFLTIDPVFEPSQSTIAKFLISKDRGQNVRTQDGYAAIASKAFPVAEVFIRHKQWIPYTHCYMVCQK